MIAPDDPFDRPLPEPDLRDLAAAQEAQASEPPRAPRIRIRLRADADGGVTARDWLDATVEETWRGGVSSARVDVAARPEFKRATRKQREVATGRAIFARGAEVGFQAARAFLDATTAAPPPAPAVADAPPPAPPVEAPPAAPDPCDACHGSRVVLAPDGALQDCEACGGTGAVE